MNNIFSLLVRNDNEDSITRKSIAKRKTEDTTVIKDLKRQKISKLLNFLNYIYMYGCIMNYINVSSCEKHRSTRPPIRY